MRRARGFTLIELMVAVAIFGVMATVAVNAFGKLASQAKQTGAVRDIFVYLLEARGQARVGNQPVRIDVTSATRNGQAVTVIQWGRLPCADTWGRNCPSSSCGQGSTCSSGCACQKQGLEVIVPAAISFTNLSGLCFVGATGQVRGSACTAASTPVRYVRMDLKHSQLPYLIVFDPLTGLGRLVDCTKPASERPESIIGTDRCL